MKDKEFTVEEIESHLTTFWNHLFSPEDNYYGRFLLSQSLFTFFINTTVRVKSKNKELPEEKEEIYPEDFKCGGCGRCEACLYYEKYEKEKMIENRGFNKMHDIASKVIAKDKLELAKKDKRIKELERELEKCR